LPRAAYSLRMSFWTVPRSFDSGIPRFFASAQYSASSTVAVALIVIDVDTLSSGIPAKSSSTS
jgi:hypothetical protein